MTQREINRAVADATGETPRAIADFGFQVEDRPVVILDPQTLDLYSPAELNFEEVA